MRRRTILVELGVATTLGLPGCVGEGPLDNDDDGNDEGESDDDGDEDGNSGDGDDESNDGNNDGDDGETSDGDPVLVGTELSRAACEEPETAAVEFDEGAGEIRVDGCIVGTTGCHVPVLVEPTLEDGETRKLTDRRLRATVGTVDDSDPDEACTQVLTELGYEATFAFEGALPSSIEVVHQTHDGERTVATADL